MMQGTIDTSSTDGKLKAIEEYRQAVASTPDLTFKSFCERRGITNYKQILWWSSGHGISIHEIRHGGNSRTGDVFVFFSKNRQSVKLLRWDTDGFLLYQKRLERGSFEMPRKNADTGYYELSWETFDFIMSGVSLDSVCFRKRYRSRFASI